MSVTKRPLTRILSLALVATAGAALVGCMPEGSQDVASVEVTVSGSSVTIAGWAWDQDTPTTPIDVHIYIDDQGMAVRADGNRPDVAAARPAAGPNHGFVATVNVAPGSHRVCSYGINAPGTDGDNVLLGCKTIQVTAPATTTPSTNAPTTSTTQAPTTTTTAPPAPLEAWQIELIGLVNAARSDAGAGSVTACNTLVGSAQSYAATMAANQWFDPIGPDGADAWTRSDAYGGTVIGEALSFGYADPTELVNSIVSSPSQSAVALDPAVSHIGIGRTWSDPDGNGPMAAAFYWVVDLGAGGTC